MMTIKKHDRRRSFHRGLLPALAILAVGLSGCLEDDEPIAPIDPDPYDGPALFERYVALGNSITAGFQSGGLHVELQDDAYPVLLAAKAEAPFSIPGIQYPGCPVPLESVLPPTLISDTELDASECRLLPVDPEIQNLAVPGAAVADLANPLWVGGGLHALLLGGRTQLGLLAENGASLVSAWVGNNDALAAGLTGEPALLTPVADFQAAYDAVVSAIAASGAQDAILIGVANPVIVPALQPGAFFWASAQEGSPFASLLEVDNSCAPTAAGGARLVSFLTVTEQLAATGGP
ncbi:MAG: SGNH/GDSL hydrolase family protein, partial [Gemmatimonadota bacterium]